MGWPKPWATAFDCHSGTAMIASNFAPLSPASMVRSPPPPTHSTESLTGLPSAAFVFLRT